MEQVTPPRPELRRFCSAYALYIIKKPVIIGGGKVVYPIGHWRQRAEESFTTRAEAQAACNRLNYPIRKRNKKSEAKNLKQIERRNKEIADWDKKYTYTNGE